MLLNMCQPHACSPTCVDQSHYMTVSTQNLSQLVLTQPTPCYRELKMHINMYWTNLYHASEDSESQHVKDKPISCQRRQKSTSTNFDLTHHPPTITLKVYQLMLTKANPRKREHKMHLNVCWPNPSHAREDTRCNSIYWPNASNVGEDTKCISNSVDHKMHHNMFWPNPSYACVSIKCTLTHVENKMHLNKRWPNTSHATKDSKCFSTIVEEIQHMPATTSNASQHVLMNPLPCQRENKMNLNMWWPNLSQDR